MTREHHAIGLAEIGQAIDRFTRLAAAHKISKPAAQVGADMVRYWFARTLTAAGQAPGWSVEPLDDQRGTTFAAWVDDPRHPLALPHWQGLVEALEGMPDWLAYRAELYAAGPDGTPQLLASWQRSAGQQIHNSPWRGTIQ